MALWLIRRYGRALEQDALQASVVNRFTATLKASSRGMSFGV